MCIDPCVCSAPLLTMRQVAVLSALAAKRRSGGSESHAKRRKVGIMNMYRPYGWSLIWVVFRMATGCAS